jgi:hypothetical protein
MYAKKKEILKEIIKTINDQMDDDKVEKFANLILRLFEYEDKDI